MPFARALTGLGLLAAGLMALWWTRQPLGLPTLSTNAETCQVLKIFDGDTLACDLNRNGRIDGKSEHVRLLGIDTPEMSYSRKNKTHKNQPFANESRQWLEDRLLNQTVRLERDVRPVDKYNRVLAHLYLPDNKISINQQLLANGMARLMFIAPNQAFKTEYTNALQQASTRRLGIWKNVR